eukprot:3891719-Alexandrium_andersonii.AAC.1
MRPGPGTKLCRGSDTPGHAAGVLGVGDDAQQIGAGDAGAVRQPDRAGGENPPRDSRSQGS